MASLAVDRFFQHKAAPGQSRKSLLGRASGRAGRSVQASEVESALCTLCGGSHTESACKIGESEPLGHNGEYQGTARVVVIPPGWSYLERLPGESRPEPARGQLWYSPHGDLYILRQVKSTVATLSMVGCRYMNTRVKLSTLRARWRYSPGVARG